MKKAVIFGATDFGQVASVYLRDDAGYEIAAFTVDAAYITQPSLLGIPIVPFETLERTFPSQHFDVFCAIGFSKVNAARKAVYERCKALGYRMPSYVNSNVHRWKETSIGEACFIFENNVIQPFVTIGDNCVLWSGNHIGHHSSIGNNVFIASHAVVSGHCTIGDNTFIGVNATLRDGIRVASNCVVGAGAVILKDTVESGVYKATQTTVDDRRSNELRNF
ncbi:MAG TPA: acetyltransferase [Candidatus Baltobacteraceae bacterium]|nr:acetyltransferase [Candidatus Baltobacteraceae bacterium]